MTPFQNFNSDISGIELPEKFTFPFYYHPHPLAIKASEELQHYLHNQDDFTHNFGIDSNDGLGKMFGVLVVQNKEGHIGYLAAFSGSLEDKSQPQNFVPPVFDPRIQDQYYQEGEKELNTINAKIKALEEDEDYSQLEQALHQKKQKVAIELSQQKKKHKAQKKKRDLKRKEGKANLDPIQYEQLVQQLKQESYNDQFLMKELIEYRNQEIQNLKNLVDKTKNKIDALKAMRKAKSFALQNRVFTQYQFLDKNRSTKGLIDIFNDLNIEKPPSGAGDCAAPKLLQYAFANDLKPVALAEFWWGASPKKEIRNHKSYYPACIGRCKPILNHMLNGIETDPNPFEKLKKNDIKIQTIYEDEDIIIINKPHEFLSVPGKSILDSVQTRFQTLLPASAGPIIVHRLDMSTSGIMVLAKSKMVHKKLQQQFIKRLVSKRYVAILQGKVNSTEGIIDLPIRVDLDDRPRQMVCYEYGKKAVTSYKVVGCENGKTRIHFFPITGRTHQLRVHSAHMKGLHTPIVGDDLYGQKSDRLYLHAAELSIVHPRTNERMTFYCDPPF